MELITIKRIPLIISGLKKVIPSDRPMIHDHLIHRQNVKLIRIKTKSLLKTYFYNT